MLHPRYRPRRSAATTRPSAFPAWTPLTILKLGKAMLDRKLFS
jgi:hypothetical protein